MWTDQPVCVFHFFRNFDVSFLVLYGFLEISKSVIDVAKITVRYCWFSHDVTKIQTKKLSILPRFYFHDALEQLKTNFHTNFRLKRVLGFKIEYA